MEPTEEQKKEIDEALQCLEKQLSSGEIDRIAREGIAEAERIKKELAEANKIPTWLWHTPLSTPIAL